MWQTGSPVFLPNSTAKVDFPDPLVPITAMRLYSWIETTRNPSPNTCLLKHRISFDKAKKSQV
jgi:hypothetical protein